MKDLVLGRISQGVITLERSGAEATLMTGAETKVVTAVNGINQNLNVPLLIRHDEVESAVAPAKAGAYI